MARRQMVDIDGREGRVAQMSRIGPGCVECRERGESRTSSTTARKWSNGEGGKDMYVQ